jgi:putative flavoprotein involved in K+ transport
VFRDGGVLVAGAGNSGAEIALELRKRGHQVWVSGRDTGHVPFRMDGLLARLFLARLVLRVVFHHVLTVKTWLGKKVRPAVISKGGPLIRVKPADLLAAGVERVSRVAGVRDGLPVLDDGRILPARNVVWCTGFDGGLSFVELPIFDPDGEPRHEAGVVPNEPGRYFVGLHFLYSMSSTMIHGVGRDARRIAGIVVERSRDMAREGRPERLSAGIEMPVELR